MKHWFGHTLFHARTQPEKPAMVTEENIVTYGMLGGAIDGCARRIAGLGLARDAPVAITVASPVRQMALSLALFRCGIPSLTIEPGQRGAAVGRLAAEFGDEAGSRLGGLGSGHPFFAMSGEWFAADSGGAAPHGFARDDDICRLCLTSGSTGDAKVFRLAIDQVGRLFDGFAAFNWNRLLCLPGLSSSFGFTTACTTLASGRTLCFSTSPYQSVRMIELFSIDFVMAATEQLLALTRAARKTGAHLDSLRTVEMGGGVPSRALLESAATHLCKHIHCRYGATETGLVARALAREVAARPGYAGRPLPGVEIAIERSDGERCRPDMVGRIKVRRGDDPHGRWADLGDLGWLSAAGELFVLGRENDLDMSAGPATISPVHEAEHLLRLEWDATDAAAILVGGADAGASGEIRIGVVDCAEASAERLAALLRARGIPNAVRLIALSSIPRGANGKVRRDQLKTLLLAEPPRPAPFR
jgi:acyl-coenzyme A synthetase/AMP-(fatty) acid ligase